MTEKRGILLIDSSLLFAHSKSKKNISLWIPSLPVRASRGGINPTI